MGAFVTMAGLLAAAPLLAGDTLTTSAEPTERIGSWPVAFLERSIELRSGVGEIHHPVQTRSAAAQAHYDQGLAYYYLYDYKNAARSFNEAIRLDPEMAMAHLWLHFAYDRLGGQEAAQPALERAIEFAEHAPEIERVRMDLRLQALEVRGGDGDGREAYLRAVDDAIQRFPEDLELRMLRALNSQDEMRVARLEEVLERDPHHIGAIHEMVHALERNGEWARAARYGERLAEIGYGIPHAVHMAGHNFPRVQRMDDAIRVLERADSLERAYMAESGLSRSYFGHFRHNLHYLAQAYWHQGRLTDAERALREAVQSAGQRSGPAFIHVPLIELMLTQGRSEEALEHAEALAADASGFLGYMTHGLVTAALLSLERLEEAEAELVQLKEEIEASGSTNPTFQRRLQRLAAELRYRSGEGDAGAVAFRKVAVASLDDRAHDGWFTPILDIEAMARAAHAAKDWELVGELGRLLIEHDPTYGGGYYLAAISAEGLGDLEAAEEAFGEARQHWKDADPAIRARITTIERRDSGLLSVRNVVRFVGSGGARGTAGRG